MFKYFNYFFLNIIKMSNGPILDLIAKNKLDEDLINIKNDTSLFNYEIKKKNKYAKGDTIFYPEGKANWGSTFRVNIERKGDLLYGLYLVVKLPELSTANLDVRSKPDVLDPINNPYRVRWAEYVGNVMVEKVTLYVNGMIIDEIFGDYMQIYVDMYISDWNRKSMLGFCDSLNYPNVKIDSEYIYIPLRFWFCNDVEKPLPVIALQHSQIYIDIKFRNFDECMSVLKKEGNHLYHSDIIYPIPNLEEVSLQANFYFLDLEERREAAMKDYEIIMTQCQFRSIPIQLGANLDITFNNTVKDLIFYIQSSEHIKYGEYFNFTGKLKIPPPSLIPLTDQAYSVWQLNAPKHILTRARLLFNGIERIEWRDAKYFYNMQNHENYKTTLHSFVYLYSFNAFPTKDNNYCGCNFSRIENPQLQVEMKEQIFQLAANPDVYYDPGSSYVLKCHATNYNFFVIKNGLGAVKYNN